MDGSADDHRVMCTACQLEIIGSEQRRVHYHSDLHLVNLKRKVGGLGPLTETEFTSRLAVLQHNKSLQQEKQRGNREKTVCDVCRKTFSSRKAFLNHEKSRRHLDTLHRQDASISDMSTDLDPAAEEGWVPYEPHADGDGDVDVDDAGAVGGAYNSATADGWIWDDDREDVDEELHRRMRDWQEDGSDRRSAFDDHMSETPNAALAYMRNRFGFFVPYKEHLRDAGGLVRYLGQKVCVGYACVACDRGFGSVEDVRRHMQDVGHCRMTSEDEAFFDEYDEFYDWRGANSDAGEVEDDLTEEDGWVEISANGADVDTAGDMDVKLDRNGDYGVNRNAMALTTISEASASSARPLGRLDDAVADTGGEAYALSIGSKVLGHRSLSRYYRQPAGHGTDERDAVVANRKASEMRVAAWRAERQRISHTRTAGQDMARRRRQCFELSVGKSNYYVRKSKFRQPMAVFNSGYRA